MRTRIVSHGLGMPSYPEGTAEDEVLDDHVMGVVAMAWLTRFPVEAWGEDWLDRGVIETRFRRHLRTGRTLVVDADLGEGGIELAIRDEEDLLYASGSAGLRGGQDEGMPPRSRRPRERGEAGRGARVLPRPETLEGYRFRPLRFEFDADRDLAFVAPLVDADFWRRHRTAHPAWLGSAANALTRLEIDFEAGGGWLHAGLRVAMHARVPDGAALEIDGRVDSVFERGGRHFAAAQLAVHADDTCVASLRNIFVFATVEGLACARDIGEPAM